MKTVDVFVPWSGPPPETLRSSHLAEWLRHPALGKVIWLGTDAPGGAEQVTTNEPRGSQALLEALSRSQADAVVLARPDTDWRAAPESLDRLLAVADDTSAAAIYADYREERGGKSLDHPTIEYQAGSIRDDFDFGPLQLLPRAKIDRALERESLSESRWGGVYDLRLRLSGGGEIVRIPEPLATQRELDLRASVQKGFDYVDPRNRPLQIEMEELATKHLRRIGAFLKPEFETPPEADVEFPVMLSVVIPVWNRERTISDAVKSALCQQVDAPYNVIVANNYSTDRTAEILDEIAAHDDRLVHLIPKRRDLGIGGCWNAAVNDPRCGRYAVQLDSDDLYADETTLQKVLETFQAGNYAMVVGSYSLVDFDLNEIPPGLIDHREWTRENGRNNALRINGLGAPRAFQTHLLRRHPLPNVSYGEDYAAGLRLSRHYEIGRIYESLYLCRRWEDNTDAALPIETANRHNLYKDRLRSIEIAARQKLNRNVD